MSTLALVGFAGAVILAMAGSLAVAQDSGDSPRLSLYLLIGQSNMAGRGAVDEESKRAHRRVLSFTKDRTWAPAVDPIHFDKASAGVGPGGTSARRWPSATSR